MSDRFSYVMSLGTCCVTSMVLKDKHLKRFSGPFDWVFSPGNMIESCLNDDFKMFLDRSQYIDIGKRVNHKSYGPIFRHHNPSKNANDYEYYLRCVERFRTLLRLPEKKLFVQTNINFRNWPPNFDKFIKLNQQLGSKTTNYKFIVVLTMMKRYARTERPSLKKVYDKDDLIIYYLVTHALCKGKSFGHIADTILYSSILEGYQYDLKDLPTLPLSTSEKVFVDRGS